MECYLSFADCFGYIFFAEKQGKMIQDCKKAFWKSVMGAALLLLAIGVMVILVDTHYLIASFIALILIMVGSVWITAYLRCLIDLNKK